jgi:hypothetical protein
MSRAHLIVFFTPYVWLISTGTKGQFSLRQTQLHPSHVVFWSSHALDDIIDV